MNKIGQIFLEISRKRDFLTQKHIPLVVTLNITSRSPKLTWVGGVPMYTSESNMNKIGQIFLEISRKRDFLTQKHIPSRSDLEYYVKVTKIDWGRRGTHIHLWIKYEQNLANISWDIAQTRFSNSKPYLLVVTLNITWRSPKSTGVGGVPIYTSESNMNKYLSQTWHCPPPQKRIRQKDSTQLFLNFRTVCAVVHDVSRL